MIFKVFYQEAMTEAPVRENTHSLYIEAENEQEVRRKLADRNYNIEFIQGLSEAFLAYEKQSDQFEVER